MNIENLILQGSYVERRGYETDALADVICAGLFAIYFPVRLLKIFLASLSWISRWRGMGSEAPVFGLW